ncbi:cache domain-containing protein [Candidatus Marinarcus aquaticus]|uniref:histidine kinase n=1 Tax=Candidatus Marinarcus aquaticus TaxID=2044504 RepID=A0A4Q0XP47_9BACT|nr:cache domain-containing protein [Candidatus Marinarcus aquaticus]RXJ56491.1 histidine kinase [Candidatus Marinarcus aquaticus]
MYKSEQRILKIIKYSPAIFILFLAVVLTFFLYTENKISYEIEKKELEQNFMLSSKKEIKNDVEKIHTYIQKEQASTEKKLRESLKHRVYEAHAIATEIYNEHQHKGKNAVTKLIKDALRAIRFNDGRGYFFIYSFDYKCILLPINKSLEGSSFYNFKEGSGRYLTREIIEQLKKENEGFLSWSYHKPNDFEHSYKKIGFNKKFKPYGWYIGTGEYVDEFEQAQQKHILQTIERLTSSNNNYMFILNYEGDFLLHPNKKLQDKNLFLAQDLPQLQKNLSNEISFSHIKSRAENAGGYIEYEHHKNDSEFVEKTSYVIGFKPWNWIIGKGFYEDDMKRLLTSMKKDIDREFDEHVLKIILATASLTLILLLISTYVSKMLQNKFNEYKRTINEHAKHDAIQQNILAQQSKMAAMGEMIGNIAHQWRQPLSAITSSATGLSLKYEMKSLNQKEFDSFLDVITTSAQYLAQTIDDFRNFFIPQKTKKHFMIEDAFEKTFKLIQAQFQNRGIVFVKNIQEVQLYSLDNELIQVLINIFNNAKDQLSTLKGQKLIFIDVYEQNNKVIIKIKDSGFGIPEKIVEKIFDPYFTTKQSKHGTGIGLYMCKEIVTKHLKGKISAQNIEFEYDNEHHKGAMITIELPKEI